MALQLCEVKDIEDIWSVEGVEGRFDDNEDANLDVGDHQRIERFIERASLLYVAPALRSLATDPTNWKGSTPPTDTPESVKYLTAVIAAYLVATRRGLPAPDHVLSLYEYTIEQLGEIKARRMTLDDVSISQQTTPFLSNLIVHGHHRSAKIRVVEGSSKVGDRPDSGKIKQNSENWPYW